MVAVVMMVRMFEMMEVVMMDCYRDGNYYDVEGQSQLKFPW